MIKKICLATLIITAILFATVSADEMKGRVGLGFKLTNQSPSLSLKYWVSDNFTLSPSIAMSRLSVNGNSATEFIPGLSLAYSFTTEKDLLTFIGLNIAADMFFVNDETYTDFALSPLFGAEYFIDSHFSFSGEYRLNIIMTDSDMSTSTSINDATIIETAQFLGVHFYF